MNLPGLPQLEAISPSFSRTAARLGQATWTNRTRTPRETAAAFLGADLALNLLELPFKMHIAMARQLGISDSYLADVIINLAPTVGYPITAQALVTLNPPADGTDSANTAEIAYAIAAARCLLQPSHVVDAGLSLDDIVGEYGTLRSQLTTGE